MKTAHRINAGEIFRPKNGWKLEGFSRLLAIIFVSISNSYCPATARKCSEDRMEFSAVDVDRCSRDVTRVNRRQKHRQPRHFFGRAESSEGNL